MPQNDGTGAAPEPITGARGRTSMAAPIQRVGQMIANRHSTPSAHEVTNYTTAELDQELMNERPIFEGGTEYLSRTRQKQGQRKISLQMGDRGASKNIGMNHDDCSGNDQATVV